MPPKRIYFYQQLYHLRFLLSMIIAASSAAAIRAEVRLPAIFGAGMVLQCEKPVPVWGWAAPGETVQVEFRGQRAETTAAGDGRWRVTLAAMPPEATPATLTVSGRNTLTLPGVLVGEVWLCSGQSNMALRVRDADRATAETAAATLPRIRLFTVAQAVSEDQPRDDCHGQWVECSPATVGAFSAVGYFMGRELHAMLGRPVGLIHSSWGGTKAEAWMPRDALARDAEFHAAILDRWTRELADFPRAKAAFDADLPRLKAEWERTAAAAKAAGRVPPQAPRLRTGPNTLFAPVGLYNAMIAPLAPFALRGVAWYQAEANVGATPLYRRLFPALIAAWREAFADPRLPFLYVQLPNLARQPEPSKSGWAEMRDVQRTTLAVPHTAMAVTIDVGDPKNLHPTNKQPVGQRLALAAGVVAYGRPAEGALSPVPRTHRRENNGAAIRVEFDFARDGLATRDGAAPRGFTIAGEDRVFHPATARIERDTVVLTSERVPAPVAVRYGWADNPDCTLVHRTGLPASPFRTDDWPTPALLAVAAR